MCSLATGFKKLGEQDLPLRGEARQYFTRLLPLSDSSFFLRLGASLSTQDRSFQTLADFFSAVFWSSIVIPQMEMEFGDAEQELWEKLESFCEARELH